MSTIYQQYRVTPEQVDACSRWIDEQAKTVLYLVPSSSDPELTYHVTWDKSHNRSACDPRCRANQHGVLCWHIRAAQVHATPYAEAKRAEAEAEAMRIAYANQHPYLWSESAIQAAQERYAPHPFSLEREADQDRTVTRQCADGSWW
jgi:hypothetical protein